jgi:hypothetical protein
VPQRGARHVASSPAASPVSAAAADTAADTAAVRGLFEENIDAIHKRDRARYLATYLQTPSLARNGPGGLELGFAEWPARRDSTWPDTLVARDLRLVPVAPDVVYGTYHYRVTQGGRDDGGRVRARLPQDAGRVAHRRQHGVRAPEGAATAGGRPGRRDAREPERAAGA